MSTQTIYLSNSLGSSSGNYTSSKRKQHNKSRVQHETTRLQHDRKRDNTSTARQNTRQHEYNTTQHEYKGSPGNKNRALHCTFCYWTIFFLNFFRNTPTCYIVSTLSIPKAYNTSFRSVKQPRIYHVLRIIKRLLDIKLKIAIQVPETYIYPLFSDFYE